MRGCHDTVLDGPPEARPEGLRRRDGDEGRRRQVLGQPVVGMTAGERPDIQARMVTQRLHPDAIAEKRALCPRAGWIDRDDCQAVSLGQAKRRKLGLIGTVERKIEG